jgi:Tfp pilus assembly protein PilV
VPDQASSISLTRQNIRGRTSARRAAQGFTVVEVLMATFVMALAISSSVTTLQVGYRSIDTARNMTLAGQILQSMIEDIRLKQYAEILTMPARTTGPIATFDTTGSFTGFSTTAARMLNRFTFTRTIGDVTGQSGMKVIVLTATWVAIDGRSSSVNYTTYYAQNGLYDYYYPVTN